MPYATVTDLIDRYDSRDLGGLVSDNDTQVSETSLVANRKALAALSDASGEIDAAMLVGNRYSVFELSNLTGHSKSHLIRITCDIAAARIMGRRIGRDGDKIKLMIEVAEEHLERLRNGENVFNLTEQKAAGNPSATGLTTLEYEDPNRSGLIRDRTGNRYYPRRPYPGTLS